MGISTGKLQRSDVPTFLVMATPSSHSRTGQSIFKDEILAIFFKSSPGMYITARRGKYISLIEQNPIDWLIDYMKYIQLTN
jgi:hypothetical protein